LIVAFRVGVSPARDRPVEALSEGA